jgi:hypothetical protein
MNSFDHMVMALNKAAVEYEKLKLPKIEVQPNPDKIKITQEEFDNFYKEFVFEKLKGVSLASAFSEKFKITDVIFMVKTSDDFALDFIKTHYLK